MTEIKIPLKMHVGGPCKPVVKAGDKVKRGQLIAEPSGLGANIHASFTGEISAVPDGEIVKGILQLNRNTKRRLSI